jgi:hypothetical protein
VAIVAGSFAPLGGHNLIEACGAGTPVIVGPHTHNFEQAVADAIEAGAAERAADAAAIAAAVQSAAAAPAATPAPAVANAADGAAADAKAAPAEPGPPPALYACRTWDDADYLTEDAKPAERCAPLQVVGMDGIARADAAACEKTVDQCAAVPAEGLCQAWRRRVDEAEFRWKFAGAKQDDDRRREYELLEATLAHSDCTR